MAIDVRSGSDYKPAGLRKRTTGSLPIGSVKPDRRFYDLMMKSIVIPLAIIVLASCASKKDESVVRDDSTAGDSTSLFSPDHKVKHHPGRLNLQKI